MPVAPDTGKGQKSRPNDLSALAQVGHEAVSVAWVYSGCREVSGHALQVSGRLRRGRWAVVVEVVGILFSARLVDSVSEQGTIIDIL